MKYLITTFLPSNVKMLRKSTDDSLKFNNKNWKFSNEGNPNINLLQKKENILIV